MAEPGITTSAEYPAGNEKAPILVIRRHSFGLIVLYIQAAIGLIAAMVLIYFLVTGFIGGEAERSIVLQLFGIIGVAAIILAVLILAAATYIYTQTKMIITDDSLTQILQTGLLSRRISKLNLSHIEDVTAEQSGIFPRLLDFGTLNVETAGEQENFHFIFCPQPTKCAQLILDAHHSASATPSKFAK